MPLDIGGLFKKGGAKLVEVLGDALDKNITNKEERDAAKLAIEQEANRHMEALMADATRQQELENADRDSARKMQEAALAQNDLFSKRFTYYLAAFVIVSAVGYGVALLFVPVPEENKRMVEQFNDMFTLTGALMVLSFFYGAAHRIANSKHAK
jgi:hypothetical protein